MNTKPFHWPIIYRNFLHELSSALSARRAELEATLMCGILRSSWREFDALSSCRLHFEYRTRILARSNSEGIREERFASVRIRVHPLEGHCGKSSFGIQERGMSSLPPTIFSRNKFGHAATYLRVATMLITPSSQGLSVDIGVARYTGSEWTSSDNRIVADVDGDDMIIWDV